jgi:hypothetical protein
MAPKHFANVSVFFTNFLHPKQAKTQKREKHKLA